MRSVVLAAASVKPPSHVVNPKLSTKAGQKLTCFLELAIATGLDPAVHQVVNLSATPRNENGSSLDRTRYPGFDHVQVISTLLIKKFENQFFTL
jgi:hypothetical protein